MSDAKTRLEQQRARIEEKLRTLPLLPGMDNPLAASEDQVRAMQEFLRAKGYYKRSVDGIAKGFTGDAVDAYLKDRNQVLSELSQIDAALGNEETRIRQDDPLNQAWQATKSIGVPVAGYAAGHYLGRKFGNKFDERAASQAEKLRDAANYIRETDTKAPTSGAQVRAAVKVADRERYARGGRSPAQWIGPLGLLGFSELTVRGAPIMGHRGAVC